MKATTTIYSAFPATQESSNLTSLVSRSGIILFKAHNIFPFDLFPDYIAIDEEKVNFVYHSFYTQEVHSVLIQDITNVTVYSNLFLATLQVTDSSNVRFPITLKLTNLPLKDALRARRIIQGLVAVKSESIELPTFNTKKLLEKIETIGEAGEIE